MSCGREAPGPRRRRRRQPERKFPGRARPRRAVVEAARGEGCRSRASRLPPPLSALGRRGSARREAGEHRWPAAAAKLGGGGCCECERRRGARGHTESYRGCGRARAPRPSGQVRGTSNRTAPALRARAASASVPASPPRRGATVSGARTPRARTSSLPSGLPRRARPRAMKLWPVAPRL